MLFKRNKRKKTEDLETLGRAEEYLKTQPKVVCNPYPEYDRCVLSALATLTDDNYRENYDKLDTEAIESMSLKQIATMYTFISRGERFCDGHIASYIEDGTLYRLVQRHIALLRA